MLERSHLALIRAVVAHGTLTRAADALCLSQSALSHAARKLEEQVGTPLWVKEGRSLRLTQAGRFLHQLAQNLLPQFEHAENQLRHYAGEINTPISSAPVFDCKQMLVVASYS